MRIRSVLGVCLIFLLVGIGPAGCAGGDGDDDGVASAGGSPTASTSSSAPGGQSDRDSQLRFARCMRASGVPNFPDPQSGQGVDIPEGSGKAAVDAAMEKCRQYAPNGGQPPTLDPQAVERARQMARCMRANGVPKFPDPNANGLFNIDANQLGMQPQSPQFIAANRKCAKYAPNPSQTPNLGSNR